MKKWRESVGLVREWTIAIIIGVIVLGGLIATVSQPVMAAPVPLLPPLTEHVETFVGSGYVEASTASQILKALASSVNTKINAWLAQKGSSIVILDRKVQVAVTGGPARAVYDFRYVEADKVFVLYTITIFYAE